MLQVCILDMSGSGLRIRSRLPIPCGESIEVEFNGEIVNGKVCRCNPQEDAYELGVEVSQTTPAILR